MKWQTLALILGGVFLVGLAVSLLRETPEFSGDEEAIVTKLEPVLDTLLLTEEDASSLGYYVSCPEARVYETNYFDYRSEGDSLEVEDLREGEPDESVVHAMSPVCDYETGSLIDPLVALFRDKEQLLFEKRLQTALAQHREEDLQQLVEVNGGDLFDGEELVDARWINAPGLGHTRDAWTRTVADQETGERYALFQFHFTRGVVEASLYVRLPSAATAESDALSLAHLFDDRIAAKLQSLTAEVQAH